MTDTPVTGVFNDAYLAGLYDSFLRDPASVDESWRQLFKVARTLSGIIGEQPAGSAADPELLRKVAAAAALADGIRQYGHLAVPLDPLGSAPLGAAELKAEFYGIGDADLQQVAAAALADTRSLADRTPDANGDGSNDADVATAADVVARLRRFYSTRIGFEFAHIEEEEERDWFRRAIEEGELAATLRAEEKVAVLQRLTEVDGLERFLGRAYLGVKRFSIEGTDMLVPMLDAAIEGAAASSARQVVIGMAHRGRLNVLVHILGKPYAQLFAEFEGQHPASQPESGTGDVKYHLGARGQRRFGADGGDDRTIEVALMPNPSHLEFVNPVLEGVARAGQRTGDDPSSGKRDEGQVLPILVHGDAAFMGEGIVAETLNLSRLAGFRTGGTLHIIVNNQVGFTTDPADGRSTWYASDLAKGFEVPILHVNGDDAESCIAAVRLGIAYRERFGKDFLIDLVGYRRHGHNETDEPSFTQPVLYEKIRGHPTPREVFGARLVKDAVVSEADVEAFEASFMERLGAIHDEVSAKSEGAADTTGVEASDVGHATGDGTGSRDVPGDRAAADEIDTRVDERRLRDLNERLILWPEDLEVHKRLAKNLQRRREAIESEIDWGHAEALAFATILMDGTSIRLSGQDAERGTFSHRQAVLHDMETGSIYIPLQQLRGAKGAFEIWNSPLSEAAVLAFEYGYSVAAADALVLWEAQFGDFVNVAAPVIDQFLAADRSKWGQTSSVVLLLPHGYEGQGPEHSSARLERFLQLCAEGNMVVAYPSTPAQYFHVLRLQAKRSPRCPLVLMQPKSLLRLREAMSSLDDLSSRGFFRVIDDPAASREGKRELVERLVLCTGKIYYDILASERGPDTAVVRVEQLYPWPHDAVARIVDLYPALEEVVWAQEEPKNMGAWTFVASRLRASTGNAMPVRYVGRPERASPAEGYHAAHVEEQERIVADALAPARSSPPPRRRATARS
ncbi:MAG: 2-oxoglutarate dehydrogenase E1 component [Gemmatimonadaceae bacterium]